MEAAPGEDDAEMLEQAAYAGEVAGVDSKLIESARHKAQGVRSARSVISFGVTEGEYENLKNWSFKRINAKRDDILH